MHAAPISGKCRVYLIDEAHRLTADAQDAFLKILEDTPDHVYFFLCTTDPGKLKQTVRTRCTEVQLRLLSTEELREVVRRVCKSEGMKLSQDVEDALVEAAGGSARKALVLLHSVIGLKDEDQQLEAIRREDAEQEAIEVARLLFKPRVSWSQAAAVLKQLKADPEQVRWLVLSYARTVLLSGTRNMHRAAEVIDVFSRPFYDSKDAGLALAVWELVVGFKE